MKTRIIAVFCILALFCYQKAFAADTVVANIICDVVQYQNSITITGEMPNQYRKCKVSLLVGGRENYFYAEQINSNSNGEFEFSFLMPENMKEGIYQFEIGSDATALPYKGQFEYLKNIAQIKCDPVQLSGANVRISGIVENYDGLSLVWLSVKDGEEVIYGGMTTNSQSGYFVFNFLMPEGAESGTYEFEISSNTVDGGYAGSFVYSARSKLFVDKTINGIAGEKINVILGGSNIKSLIETVFTLTYNPEHIFVNTNDSISKTNGRVELISCEEGKIIFRLNSEYANGQRQWQGAAEIFKVQFNSNYSGETTITLSYEDTN